jgi:hypothetical protein
MAVSCYLRGGIRNAGDLVLAIHDLSITVHEAAAPYSSLAFMFWGEVRLSAHAAVQRDQSGGFQRQARSDVARTLKDREFECASRLSRRSASTIRANDLPVPGGECIQLPRVILNRR